MNYLGDSARNSSMTRCVCVDAFVLVLRAAKAKEEEEEEEEEADKTTVQSPFYYLPLFSISQTGKLRGKKRDNEFEVCICCRHEEKRQKEQTSELAIAV